jgi:hypothetical protein
MQLQPVHVWYGTTCSWVPWAFGNHHPQDLASRVDSCSACLSPWCSWSTLVSIQGCADTALIASIPADVLDPAKLCSVPVTRAAVVWSPKQQSCVFGTHRCAQVASGVDLPTIHPINLSALIWTSCLDFFGCHKDTTTQFICCCCCCRLHGFCLLTGAGLSTGHHHTEQ